MKMKINCLVYPNQSRSEQARNLFKVNALILVLLGVSLIGCTESHVLSIKKPPRLPSDAKVTNISEEFRDQLPIFRKAPLYPNEAMKKGIEGWVALTLDVDTYGKTKNVKVVDSSPPSIFDQSAKSSVEHYLYKPFLRNGEAVEMHDLAIIVSFQME